MAVEQAATQLVLKDRNRRRDGLRRIAGLLIADRLAFASVVFLSVVLACVFFPSYLSPYDPTSQVLRERLLPPAWMEGGTLRHLLGTDVLGRDVVSRLIYGTRYSFAIASGGVAVAFMIGVTLGAIGGYFGGAFDAFIMRIVDVQLSFTGLLFIMLLVVFLGPGPGTLIVVFGLFTWVLYARIVRGALLYLREATFVQAARVIGCSHLRILVHHILPQLVLTLCSLIVLEISRLIITEASLSFLGLGIQPPDISWGLMSAEGQDYVTVAWWLIVFPGLAIFLSVLAVNFLGIWLRALTDPYQQQLLSRRE